MLETTMTAVTALVKSDSTIPPDARRRILAACRDQVPEARSQSKPTGPRVVSRAEAAAAMGRSVRFIDSLARRGLLRRVRLPDRKRAAGVRFDDLEKLIEDYSAG